MATVDFQFLPSSLMCSCGLIMYYHGVWVEGVEASYSCTNPHCEHRDVKYKLPTVELERVDA
jgi:hypothetical protein